MLAQLNQWHQRRVQNARSEDKKAATNDGWKNLIDGLNRFHALRDAAEAAQKASHRASQDGHATKQNAEKPEAEEAEAENAEKPEAEEAEADADEQEAEKAEVE